MSPPHKSDAQKYIDLAERMGIPTDEAFRRLLQQMAERDRSDDDAPNGGELSPSLNAG